MEGGCCAAGWKAALFGAAAKPRIAAVTATAAPAPAPAQAATEEVAAVVAVVDESCLRITDVELVAVARFLSFGDVARLAMSGSVVADPLTAPCKGSAQRKLVVPVVEVKLQSMDILRRASAAHAEYLRVWSRGAFEEVRRVLQEEGLGAFSALEKLSAKGCALHPCDVDALGPLIGSSPQIKLVNFEKNQLHDDVVKLLVASGAFEKSALDTLNMRFNQVSDGTAAALAQVLAASHPTLETVNLKMNRITDIGAVQLAEAIRSNRVLRVLNLRRQHPGLTDRTAKAFALAIDGPSALERLLLRRNKITDQGCEALAAAATRRVARARAAGDISSSNSGAVKPSAAARRLLPQDKRSFRLEIDLEENRVGTRGALAMLRVLQAAGPGADIEVLLFSSPGLERASLRQALVDLGEDPAGADDPRLRIETSKPELAV